MSRSKSTPRQNNPSNDKESTRSGRQSRGAASREARGPDAGAGGNRRTAGEPDSLDSTSPGLADLSYGWPLRDFLVSCILLTLSMQRAHGYFIEQYLRSFGFANVEMSTLYRTLRKLEKDGLISSSWEPGPGGPARRVYTLTDAGRWWLDVGVAALKSYRELIDNFFASYTGLSYKQENEGD